MKSNQATLMLPAPATLEADASDAKRIIQAAMLVSALPNICSERAREMATAHLRSVLARHPSSPPLLRAIIEHLEKP